MEAAVKLGFGECTDAETERQGACVTVKNVGDTPINEIKVSWDYDFETPQPVRKHESMIKVHEVGRSFYFCLAAGEQERPLAAGEERTYLYPMQWLGQMRSVIQSLSPERYSVKIALDGEVETGIPGSVWGDFIQRRFPDA